MQFKPNRGLASYVNKLQLRYLDAQQSVEQEKDKIEKIKCGSLPSNENQVVGEIKVNMSGVN